MMDREDWIDELDGHSIALNVFLWIYFTVEFLFLLSESFPTTL